MCRARGKRESVFGTVFQSAIKKRQAVGILMPVRRPQRSLVITATGRPKECFLLIALFRYLNPPGFRRRSLLVRHVFHSPRDCSADPRDGR